MSHIIIEQHEHFSGRLALRKARANRRGWSACAESATLHKPDAMWMHRRRESRDRLPNFAIWVHEIMTRRWTTWRSHASTWRKLTSVWVRSTARTQSYLLSKTSSRAIVKIVIWRSNDENSRIAVHEFGQVGHSQSRFWRKYIANEDKTPIINTTTKSDCNECKFDFESLRLLPISVRQIKSKSTVMQKVLFNHRRLRKMRRIVTSDGAGPFSHISFTNKACASFLTKNMFWIYNWLFDELDRVFSVSKMSSFWRASNQSYLKYVNIASALVRRVLKEPFKTRSKPLDDAQFSGAKIGPDGKVAERGMLLPSRLFGFVRISFFAIVFVLQFPPRASTPLTSKPIMWFILPAPSSPSNKIVKFYTTVSTTNSPQCGFTTSVFVTIINHQKHSKGLLVAALDDNVGKSLGGGIIWRSSLRMMSSSSAKRRNSGKDMEPSSLRSCWQENVSRSTT